VHRGAEREARRARDPQRRVVDLLLGGWDQMSSTGGLLSFPEMIWEGGVLGVYLIVKGFRAPAATAEEEPVIPDHAPALAAS
jgi:hypothetical protein